MATTNGVIETSSGDLLRAGKVDWTLDGSFDGTIETVRTDVPTPPKVRGNRNFPQYRRWNGAAWVQRTDVNTGNRHTITAATPYKISLRGATNRNMRINLESNAIINFLDASEGTNLYLLVVQDALGGWTLTVRFEGQNMNVDYPPAMRAPNDQATIMMTRFARRLLQVGRSNEI